MIEIKQNIKTEIEAAIKAFQTGNLTNNALGLFKTLGYNTEAKQSPFTQKTYDYFKEYYADLSENEFNEEKAQVKDWKYIDLLFQLSDEELKEQCGNFKKEVIIKDDGTKIAIESYLFFVIELKNENPTRTTLSQINREINKVFSMPVMILFKYGKTLTLSVIDRRLNKIDEQKDVLKKVTLIKDISTENPHRAHIEIFFDLTLKQLHINHKFENFVNLHKAWQKTLNIKELNNKFYNELFKWYLWAGQNVNFPQIRPDADKIPDEAHQNESIIRLLTRLLFCWFMKEKQSLIPKILFNQSEIEKILKGFSMKKTNTSVYYRAILQNLFFATLGVPIKPRKYIRESFQGKNIDYGNPFVFRYQDEFVNHKENLKIFKNIPFLNGGLFECLDEVPGKGKDLEDEVRLDGFSTNKKKQATVPDFLFWGEHKEIDLSKEFDDKRKKNETVHGIIDILNAYKFTVEENTPLEEEIALDPELLGKVFENLLASYNPETKNTARKQTGSFYTPREIVNYMVDESLTAYLKQKLEDEGIKDKENNIRDIISYSENKNPFNEQETKLLINAIDSCKILDPACGSGAFPMGILHKLTHILHKIDYGNKLWEQKQLEKAQLQDDIEIRTHLITDIEAAFKNNELNYGRKLYLIKNCIHGIDIQPIAIQIAKLRFFISLVVDQKVNAKKENFGIRSLPNLDFKLICANTLIGAPEKLTLKKEGDLGMEIEDPFFEKFNSLTDKYFSASLPMEKKKITGDIKKLVNKKVQDKISEANRQGEHSDERFNKFIAKKYKTPIEQKKRDAKLWESYNNLFKHESVGFFEIKYFFPKAKTGFDVVIGNPPYLESRNKLFNKEIKNKYQEEIKSRGNEKFITGGADLLIYFYEISVYLIKRNGIITFITQNSWLHSDYGKKFQNFLLAQTNAKAIIDSDYKYFDSYKGPNVNAVISIFIGNNSNVNNIIYFARYFKDFAEVQYSYSKIAKLSQSEIADVKFYKYADKRLNEYKWGILFEANEFVMNIFKKLKDKTIKTKNITIGQGLNESKDCEVDENFVRNNKLDKIAIPLMTSEDGAQFNLTQTKKFVIDIDKITKTQARLLKSHKYKAIKVSTRKRPNLILPRGLGRYFCSNNDVQAYSASCVEIYNISDKSMCKNIWLFLNSSIGWLIREISGRKNLGGGMLKAEATDLKDFPIYFDFKNKKQIDKLYASLKGKEALHPLKEILTPNHQQIDQIVFDFFEFTKMERKQIIEIVNKKINSREQKSKNK